MQLEMLLINMAKSLSEKAIDFVIRYEKKRDCDCEDVQSNKKYKGFDLISRSRKNRELRKIEVKGTRNPGRIPDCFETEFIKGKLVATHLYAVGFGKSDRPVSLHIIPRKAIKPEHIMKTCRYRIKSAFYTQELLQCKKDWKK